MGAKEKEYRNTRFLKFYRLPNNFFLNFQGSKRFSCNDTTHYSSIFFLSDASATFQSMIAFSSPFSESVSLMNERSKKKKKPLIGVASKFILFQEKNPPYSPR